MDLIMDNGANDYVTKPFYIDELVARVNVQLRNADLLDMAKQKIKLKKHIIMKIYQIWSKCRIIQVQHEPQFYILYLDYQL